MTDNVLSDILPPDAAIREWRLLRLLWTSCPRCDGHACQYPPPPCTASPDSCGTGKRCRTDGTCEVIPCTDGNACFGGYRCNPALVTADNMGCEPIPCDQGNTCPSGRQCNPGSSRVDGFGCELIRCDAGYACPAGTRCNIGSAQADDWGWSACRAATGMPARKIPDAPSPPQQPTTTGVPSCLARPTATAIAATA